LRTTDNKFKDIDNEHITGFINNEDNIKELIDLGNIENEIKDEKILKKENHAKEKVISEKKLLNMFVEEFNTDEWKKIFKAEKIVSNLGNAKVHVAVLSKKFAKQINIKLVFLEKYASDINHIERVWCSIKDRLSVLYIEDDDFLLIHFKEFFYYYSNLSSLVENWLHKFIT
jgi:transposase